MKTPDRPLTPNPARRLWLGAGLAGLTGLMLPGWTPASTPVLVEVWKDPSCGCCGDWVKHLQANGLAVKVNEVGNTTMRKRLGVDIRYGSCHTALVGGYAIEGHVPAREIHRLLKERPAALGLAVPGMPVGSPGMDGEVYGGRKDPYDVLLLARDGSAKVFQAYR